MKFPTSFIFRFILCFIPVAVFSMLFTQVTIYTVYYLLHYFNPIMISNLLIVKTSKFEFVDACIVPYAYYFFWVLCLFTKDIILKTRIKMIVYGFAMIFVMNILRIIFVIWLDINYGLIWFNIIHMFIWHFISGVYVALVWIILVKIYKIKSIPFYSDIKELYKLSLLYKK